MPLLDYEELWTTLRQIVLSYGDEIQKAANAPSDWPDFKYHQGKLHATRHLFTVMHEMEQPEETNGESTA